jgi:hypothetical protein
MVFESKTHAKTEKFRHFSRHVATSRYNNDTPKGVIFINAFAVYFRQLQLHFSNFDKV